MSDESCAKCGAVHESVVLLSSDIMALCRWCRATSELAAILEAGHPNRPCPDCAPYWPEGVKA